MNEIVKSKMMALESVIEIPEDKKEAVYIILEDIYTTAQSIKENELTDDECCSTCRSNFLSGEKHEHNDCDCCDYDLDDDDCDNEDLIDPVN